MLYLLAATTLAAGMPADDKMWGKLSRKSEADYTAKMVTVDDELKTVAIISTKNGPHAKPKVPGGVGFAWLHAAIDKKTGVVVYQVVQTTEYWGSWRFYRVATYATPSGPIDTNMDVLDRTLEVCMSTCRFSETTSFTVSEALLRSIAADSSNPWRVRFDGNGQWDTEIAPVEASALMAAVNTYKAEHHLPN